YVVLGSEKTAIIEASHPTFSESFLEIVEEGLQGRTPDYLILNHTEPDHSGAVTALVDKYPGIALVASQAASIYLKNITNRPELPVRVVRDGDRLSLGDKTLTFINAPFLHWPDSMFTWLEEERALFTCDFLGCHFCEPEILDNRITYPSLYEDALEYYYQCIFAPFAPYVLKGLDKIKDLDIDCVCPSHGPILTKGCRLEQAIEKYRKWAAPAPKERPLVPLFYCTAYGNTEKLAMSVREGILEVLPEADAPVYNMNDIGNADLEKLSAALNASDAFLIGSPTINRDAVPPVWRLLSHVDAINIAKRPVALFGSFGWSGEALPHVSDRL
ncbi:MAG TPA: FprA family A-type flavoprotein, partial [Clostridia bacterium]|nr:FprA family A-type flavoprotein [Clostridia bacterium]